MGLFSSLFGSDGGNSTTSTQTTTNNADRRFVADGGSIGLSAEGSTVYVTATDQGAIRAALDMSQASTQATAATLLGALGIAADSLEYQQSAAVRAAQSSIVDDLARWFERIEPAQWVAAGLAVAGLVLVLRK